MLSGLGTRGWSAIPALALLACGAGLVSGCREKHARCVATGGEAGADCSANLAERGSGGLSGSLGTGGSGGTETGTILSEGPPEWERTIPIEARALGESYRFTVIDIYSHDYLIAAEGAGPPMIVATDGCFAEPQVLTVNVEDEDTHIAALTEFGTSQSTFGWTVVALLCNELTCALYGLPVWEDTTELEVIPGSELPPIDVFHFFTETRREGATAEHVLCVTTLETRRCFGSAGWEPEVEIQVDIPPAPDPPQCEGYELVLYASPYGVTASGEVILVQTAGGAEPACEKLTDPLGTPILLFERPCFRFYTKWLLTQQGFYRGFPLTGCECPVE